MKRIYLVAVMACAFSMTACASTGLVWPSGPPGGPVVSGHGAVVDEKALIAAELAYNVPAQAYIVAVDRGLLTGDRKDVAKALLMDSFVALKLAREAYRAGNADSLAAQVAISVRLIGQAKAIIPGAQ